MFGRHGTQRTRCLVALFLAVCCGAVPSSAAAAEEFVLHVPGRGDLTSTAIWSGNRLAITDSRGQTFIYTRQPRLDTADGAYLGFASPAARQTLRWPADGVGAMQIGDPAGRGWRVSQQQVRPVAAPAPVIVPRRRVTARRPNYDAYDDVYDPVTDGVGRRDFDRDSGQDFGRDIGWNGVARGGSRATIRDVGYLTGADGRTDVGFIDERGRLQLYHGRRDSWRERPVSLRDPLVPGAGLALAPSDGPDPFAYTIDPHGQLVRIDGERAVPVWDDWNDAPLQPGGPLVIGQGIGGRSAFTVDRSGRLWQVGLGGARPLLVDQVASRFQPGTPVGYAETAAGPQLFLVDAQGSLLEYAAGQNGWSGPGILGRGFPPGAPVATVRDPRAGGYVAAVDAFGRPQVFARRGTGWTPSPIAGETLPPGARLAMALAPDGLMLTAIDGRGQWRRWSRGPRGGWDVQPISLGFPTGGPVAFDPLSMAAFGIDATGRLVADVFWEAAWHPYLLLPGPLPAPRLVDRQVTPNAPLDPAQVVLTNSGPEELAVQLLDLFEASPPRSLQIPAGGAVTVPIPRDSGATVREVYSVPTPAGWVEDANTYTLPPRPRFTVVAWANRVTYRYIDRKNVTVLPDFDIKTSISLGVFDLPPGAILRDGQRIDVFYEALARGNPGVASQFMPPGGGRQFVPREPPNSALPPSLQNYFGRAFEATHQPPRRFGPLQPPESQDTEPDADDKPGPIIPPLPR
jgi:hypothetical protein